MYEKTPAYYKSHVAPERIKFAKPDIKLITVGKFLENYINIKKYFRILRMKIPSFRDLKKLRIPGITKSLNLKNEIF